MVEEMRQLPREIMESKPEDLAPVSEPYVGITFISPNGTKYFVTISDDGVVVAAEVI